MGLIIRVHLRLEGKFSPEFFTISQNFEPVFTLIRLEKSYNPLNLLNWG